MKREIEPCVYIMASKRNGTLYTGDTTNLLQRIAQHREGLIGGFTREHGIKRLVWFEPHETMESAIIREKRVKNWIRQWRIALIEKDNLFWRDLAEDMASSLQSRLGPRFRGGDEGSFASLFRHPRESGDPVSSLSVPSTVLLG